MRNDSGGRKAESGTCGRRGSKRWRPEERLWVGFTRPLGEDGEDWPPGYYILVRRGQGNSRPLLIRFARQKDAELGREALLRAGLSTFTQLQKAGSRVHQIIGEAMQW